MEKKEGCSWQPVLDYAVAGRAVDALRSIAAELKADQDPSVAGGKAGQALFYSYLSHLFSKEENQQRAFNLLNEAIDDLVETPMAPSLYGGFSGIAWTVEHLQGRLLEPDDEDSNEAIDEELIDYLGHSPWKEDYDLISGLVGLGVYALERLPRQSAVECLARIVDRLNELAGERPEGITWFTRPELIPAHQLKHFPDGYYNVGLAHGVPGIIALLGGICAAGIAVQKARPLLDGAVNWLLAQRLPETAGSSFSAFTFPGIKSEGSRMAWCYGDPGVVSALFVAARSANNSDWEREAIEIALRAADKPADRCGVKDAGICHGAAGLAHIYNRFYQATGDERFKEAALLWFEQTLDMRRPGEGIGGFLTWTSDSLESGFRWEAVSGLLNGAAGIGLALLAAITPVEPQWDRMLLLSLPPHFV
jgi:lantibiotic biosynthesis protein